MPPSIVYLVLCMGIAAAVQLPFLSHITLVPKFNSTSVTLTDRSCDQCLCESNFSHSILNCFPNNTCQLFADAPLTYTLKPTPNALLYFPRQIAPNASQCCTPDGNDLLSKLDHTSPLSSPVNSPRSLVIDNHGYLVTVSYSDQSIVRFYPNNLTQIDQSPSSLLSDHPLAIAYHNEAYYVGFNNYIRVVHSSNMTILHTIAVSELQGVRDMIFLNDGQQMIVTATYSNRLVFFNRSSPTSHNYNYSGYQDVNCQGPHGLFYVSDSLFYLTSWSNSIVYKYSNVGNTSEWSETLAATASPVSSAYGIHVTIDGCDRYWLSLGAAGVQILNNDGGLLGSLYPTGSCILETLILDNYVVYLSDYFGNRIVRLALNIQC